METSWLVQRLIIRSRGEKQEGAEKAFRAGLYEGEKLTTQAMSIFHPLFEFDYMGSSEFEFGTIPKTMREFAQHEDIGLWPVTIPGNAIEKPFSGNCIPVENVTFYVVASKKLAEEVNEQIRYICGHNFRGKERTSIGDAIFLKDDKNWTSPRGWFELTNGFFFFLDKKIAEEVAAIFLQARTGKVMSKNQKRRLAAKS